jgi:hypothetical protein
MSSEANMIKIFVEYLIAHGYPESSILVEYKFGKGYCVDIAVVDQKQNIPLQIFELKSYKKDANRIKSGIDQLKTSRSALKGDDVEAYLVFPKEQSPFFEIINIDKIGNIVDVVNNNDDNGREYIELNYNGQRSKRIYRYAERVKRKEKVVIDEIKIISLIFGALVLVTIVLSKIGFFQINKFDITLIAYSIGLLWMPYASELTVLGIKFKRSTNDRNEKTQ